MLHVRHVLYTLEVSGGMSPRNFQLLWGNSRALLLEKCNPCIMIFGGGDSS